MRLALVLALAGCGEVISPLADAPPPPGDGSLATDAAPTADASSDAPRCGASLFSRDATTQLLFQLNEGSSSLIRDASGHGRDGRFAAAVSSGPTWTSGKFGGALAFSGGAGLAGDRVDIPLSPAVTWGSAFTVEAIVKPSAADPDGILIGLNPVFAVWVLDGAKVYWRLNNSASNLVGPKLDPGRWSYVATTYDGTTMRMYVDGQLAASQALTGVGQTGPTVAYLGCAPNEACFGGLVDEVRVSSAALTGAQIAATAASALACE